MKKLLIKWQQNTKGQLTYRQIFLCCFLLKFYKDFEIENILYFRDSTGGPLFLEFNSRLKLGGSAYLISKQYFKLGYP